MKAYLANGLFSYADQLLNKSVATMIRKVNKNIDLYVPQENETLNDKEVYANSQMIFEGDNFYLDKTDLLIAVIDGVEIDSGVAAEIGRFTAICEYEIKYTGTTNRKVYALYTDVRRQGANNLKKINALQEDSTENQFMYRNLYVIGAIKKYGTIFTSVPELIEALKNE